MLDIRGVESPQVYLRIGERLLATRDWGNCVDIAPFGEDQLVLSNQHPVLETGALLRMRVLIVFFGQDCDCSTVDVVILRWRGSLIPPEWTHTI